MSLRTQQTAAAASRPSRASKKATEDRKTYILRELMAHLPFSLFGVILAMLLGSLLQFIGIVAGTEERLSAASREMFHVFHPTHVLLSAVATTAMFWKHDEGRLLKAVVVGFLGSVTICGVSDVIIPFVGGWLIEEPMVFHLCAIKEPGLVYPFAVMGVIAGLFVNEAFERSTEYSHSMHVFISSAASLFYLMGYGMMEWMHHVAGVFFIIVVAVMLPCCLSDIVFPLLCSHRYCVNRAGCPRSDLETSI